VLPRQSSLTIISQAMIPQHQIYWLLRMQTFSTHSDCQLQIGVGPHQPPSLLWLPLPLGTESTTSRGSHHNSFSPTEENGGGEHSYDSIIENGLSNHIAIDEGYKYLVVFPPCHADYIQQTLLLRQRCGYDPDPSSWYWDLRHLWLVQPWWCNFHSLLLPKTSITAIPDPG
jgi:hypothetical protein